MLLPRASYVMFFFASIKPTWKILIGCQIKFIYRIQTPAALFSGQNIMAHTIEICPAFDICGVQVDTCS